MTEEEARRLLRDIAKNRWVRLTRHCRERMAQRQVVMDDMLQVLLWGQVRELRQNPEGGNWECVVVGRDIEKDPLSVKVVILEADFALLCITVFG